MNVELKTLDIIIAWLKTNGYDGLFCEDECGCLVDDLAPCGGDGIQGCTAGYNLAAAGDHFFIGPKQPQKKGE